MNNQFRNLQIGYYQNNLNDFRNLVSSVVENLVEISFNFGFSTEGVEITIYESPACLVKVKFNHVIKASISFGQQSGLVNIENNWIKEKKGLGYESAMQLPYGEFGLQSPKMKLALFKDVIENGSISYSILPGEIQIEVIIENKYKDIAHNGVIDIRIISKLNNNGPPPSFPQPMRSQNNSREYQQQVPSGFFAPPSFQAPFSNPHFGFGGSPGFIKFV